MTELALNILDIANNSTRANAKIITIEIFADSVDDILKISIIDNGCGMSEELLNKVSDPFSTTRTTRKVGMGIPLFKMAAQMAGGEFSISSKLGEGTQVTASFTISHIDRAPLGDIAGTMAVLIGGAPQSDFVLRYNVDGNGYEFTTQEVKNALEIDELTDSYIITYIQEMIKENLDNVNGGITL